MKVNGEVSSIRNHYYGVTHSSILLFLLYTSPLGDIMRYRNVDFYLKADDAQLYLTFESSSAYLAKLVIEDCLRDIDTWMTVNMLKVNRDKTEQVVVNASYRSPPPLTSISVFDEVINKSPVLKNTGILYDTLM